MKYGTTEIKVVSVGERIEEPMMDQPALAYKFWRDVIERRDWFSPDKEHVVTLILNSKCCLKAFNMVSIGSLDGSLAEPREVFRAAIVKAAYGVVVMHNHPSGNPAPSEVDLAITRKLKQAGEIIGIRVMDHVIAGMPDPDHPQGYFSMREAGVL